MQIVSTAHLLCRSPFQQLLHTDRVLLPGKSVVKQVVQLLANLFARWYALHDVWFFLLFRDGGLQSHHGVTHAA